MAPNKKPTPIRKIPKTLSAPTGAPSRSSRGVNASALTAAALAALAAAPPARKVNSDEAQELSVTPECIQAFIDYVITKGDEKNVQKWKITNQSTVVGNLIEVMVAKGYVKLTPAKIDQMIIDINKPEIRRDPIFEIIAGFTNHTFNFTAGEQRRLSTISSSSLTAATIESDPTFVCTEFSTCTNPEIKLKQNEIDLANRIIEPEKRFISGSKKECSTCWICDNPVYVYELNHSATEATYKKCGEDEHISPPGIGNIFGLLYPDKVRTSEMIHFGYVKYGLKSSHTWCNRVKSEFNLISPPETSSDEYSLRSVTLDELLAKARAWLDNYDTNRVDIDILFHQNYSVPEKSAFINRIKTTITTYINALCKEMNKTDSLTLVSDTPMIMYKLRLIFNSCLIGRDILFKTIKGFQTSWKKMNAQGAKKKGGGYKQSGGGFTDRDNIELDYLLLKIIGFDNGEGFINKNRCESLAGLQLLERDTDLENYKTGTGDDYKLEPSLNLFNIRNDSIFNRQLTGRIDYLSRLRPLDPSTASGMGRRRHIAEETASYIPSVESPPPVDVYFERRDGNYVYQYTEESVEEPYEYEDHDRLAAALRPPPVDESFYDFNNRQPESVEEAEYQLQIARDEVETATYFGFRLLIPTKQEAVRNAEQKLRELRQGSSWHSAAYRSEYPDLQPRATEPVSGSMFKFGAPSAAAYGNASAAAQNLDDDIEDVDMSLDAIRARSRADDIARRAQRAQQESASGSRFRFGDPSAAAYGNASAAAAQNLDDDIEYVDMSLDAIRARSRADDIARRAQNSKGTSSQYGWGGKKTKKQQRKSKKGRKTRKGRKQRKTKKGRKSRGGNRIGGSNIGSNCNDPNFSIYNTNMLKLFPYKGGSAIPPKSNQNLLRTQEGLELEQLTEEERQQRLEEEEERQRLEDIRRQTIQDAFINGEPVNLNNSDDSFNSDMSELRLSDLGGGLKQKKSRKGRKTRNSKKTRKSKKRKGGKLYLDDPYKNSEGPQY